MQVSGDRSPTTGGCLRRVGRSVLLALAVLATSAGTASAAGYEPNDSVPTVAGPLLGSRTYVAILESPTDTDVYYFYVASRAAARVSVTVENLGGGSVGADMDAAVTDALGTPLAAAAYIRQGEARSLTAELPPRKYFVRVTPGPGTGFGESYRLTTGAHGLGAYAVIAGRCRSGRAAARKARAAVRRARVRLQRALGRLRLSRYAGPEALRSAHRQLRRARSSVRKERRPLRAARRSQRPWCSIPR